ncbi:hypothetical protein HYH02_005370 [Chlamydomonas schloesseri]|uniref:Protein kinase domain-containing protein n=1 Tax=Chlamydomonas schloesseri TaxID=2026947 RepID=A0A835WLK1_9CHLO|nr:hypothetical protein HYH02_005370 [Chlamydomonas schloesseri]|eukprot:KAG2449847.1 hypothetical protein HYH02_005370 [Chlamydomonas schloesseri]
MKSFLKSHKDLEDDGKSDAAVHVRPASASVPRVVSPGDDTKPKTVNGMASPASASPMIRRVDSLHLAPSARVDSITHVTSPHSRFETTIIERQGSRVVLQGVKTMKPDSDDEGEDDAGAGATDMASPSAPHSGHSAYVAHAGSRPGTPSHAAAAAAAGRPGSGTSRFINATAAHGSGGPGSPGALPSVAGAPGSPKVQQAAAAAAAGAGGAGAGPGAIPAGFRRGPNRVASLPMLLDGGMPRPPRPHMAEEGLPEPEYAGPQEPEKRVRRPPKRSESLKYLLHLDQYSFNQDVSVSEARQVATGGVTITPQGQLEDIINTNGTSTSILAVSSALPHRMRRPRWSLDDYQLLKQLHRGYASDVYQARCKVSGEMVALKVYKLAEQGDIQRMQLYREIKLHAGLRHSNVVQYYACFLEQNRVVLVTEFCTGGDLLRIMYKCGGRLFERQAVNMVLQPFLTALHYLHTQGIVHRDIKPENVLFAEGKILKLADFGLAINLKEERANTRAGTLDYMAPEVLRCPTKKTPDENKENPQSAHYHTSVDAWAVGVFAYELIVGAPPFKAAQMIDTARNIIHANVSFPDTVSDLARDFISRALHKDCNERLTVLDMLHHPWITMFQRRSSVRIVYTRSNSLMELMPPTADGQPQHQHQHQQQGGGGGGSSSRRRSENPAPDDGRGSGGSSNGGAMPASPHAGMVRRASRLGMVPSGHAAHPIAAGGGGAGGGHLHSGSHAYGTGGGGGSSTGMALSPSGPASGHHAYNSAEGGPAVGSPAGGSRLARLLHQQ